MPSPNTIPERIAHKLVRNLPRRVKDVVPERPIVSFTFDDVPVSARENGAAILERHGVLGTFYVAGGIAGAMHDGQLMLDDAGYRDLASRGHEIGHHGFAHRTPSALRSGYRGDLDRNDAYLSAIIDGYARNFAFPYGRSSLGARRHVGERFRSARGVEMGINRDASDFDLLRAVQMQSHSTAAGLTRWIDDVVAMPGWLIYLTHDVKDDASEYGVRPDLLDHVVSYAIATGCEVLTIDAALDRLEIEA